MTHNEYYCGPSYGIGDKQDKPFSPVCSKCNKEFEYMEIMFEKGIDILCENCFMDWFDNKTPIEIAECVGFEVTEYAADDWR